jgi:hypothetical protein
MDNGTILLLAILVIVFLVVDVALFMAWRKPDIFRVERRATIHAPAETVFAGINDLVAWQGWSPWAKKDPNAKATFGTITVGTGATFGWDGDRNVGKGQMTITDSRPVSGVTFRLDFEKPFKGTNIAEFTLTPVAGGTEVVWAMHGPANLMSKVMDLLLNMDRMVGRDFEAGLANLKAIAESKA